MREIVYSPSNLKVYRDCPYKFYQQYIQKTIPFEQSPAAARGEKLHSLMEAAVKHGWNSIQWPEVENLQHAKGFIEAVDRLKASGWSVQAELQAATDGLGNVTDWWDKPPQNFIRSKVDVCATHPDHDHGIIIDWKTGKPWDDELQLQVNAWCLYPTTRLKKYQVMFAYLDSGVVRNYEVELDILCPKTTEPPEKIGQSKLYNLLELLDRLTVSRNTDTWEATKNKFCNWCPVDCPKGHNKQR